MFARLKTVLPSLLVRLLLPVFLSLMALWANVVAEDFSGNPNNYRSLLNQLQTGSVLYLEPGTYSDGLPVIDRHGEPGSPIVITGPEQGDPAVFTGQACCNTVQISNSSYVTVKNIRVDGDNIPGIDAVNGRGVTHHITISGLTIVGHAPDQGTIGISTKGPAWDWLIKDNEILEAGTGMYLGNSDGSEPFVRGVIEHNVIVDTIGYNIEIKHQNPWPMNAGLPEGINKTIIRHNVFSKQNNASSGGMARPNLLVGHAPDTGSGTDDYFEIYGNFLYQNPSEVLFQGEGNIAFYNNILINDSGPAVNIQPHNGVPKKVDVFMNTVVASGYGIRIQGGAAEYEQQAVGNAVFASASITAPVSQNNISDTYQAAEAYLAAPFDSIGSLDVYPLSGQLQGEEIDMASFAGYTHSGVDFNGDNRLGLFRGAYAGEGVNPGWQLSLANKPRNTSAVIPPPEITMTANPVTVEVGGFTTISWSVTNADECNASGHSSWQGVKPIANTVGEVVGPLEENIRLTLSCSNQGVVAENFVIIVAFQSDLTPPEIDRIEVADNGQSMLVYFSEAVETTSAENVNNYAVSNGVSILAAQIQADMSSLRLTTTQLSIDTVYTLSVSNLEDLSIPPNRVSNEISAVFSYVLPDDNNPDDQGMENSPKNTNEGGAAINRYELVILWLLCFWSVVLNRRNKQQLFGKILSRLNKSRA
jgi:hypothetical protein